MTTWDQIEPGMLVMHREGDHADAPHRVLSVRSGGAKLRIVLQPEVDGLAAKVALRVSPSDEPEMPEGATEQVEESIESVITEEMGGTLVAVIDKKGRTTCPAVDITTVATHLKVMHGVELRGLPGDEAEMLRLHDELHAAPFHEPEYPHTHEGAA